jgi:peptide-methionine (R)-S-oxide reductase
MVSETMIDQSIERTSTRNEEGASMGWMLRTVGLGVTLMAAVAVVGLRADDPGSSASNSNPNSKATRRATRPMTTPTNEPAATTGEAGTPDTSGPVVKSEREWQQCLTPAQFMVLRQKGTEPAWTGRYARGHFSGVFACAGCGAELFSSTHKFESGTGWPSFFRPIDPSRVATEVDHSMPFETRVEVLCARCGGHLGHVFRDGPPPTGLRFCINSVSLQLKKPEAKKASATTAAPAPKAEGEDAGPERTAKQPEE